MLGAVSSKKEGKDGEKMKVKIEKLEKKLQKLESFLKDDPLKNWSHESLMDLLHYEFLAGSVSQMERIRAEFERRELIDHIDILKDEKECFFCKEVKKTQDSSEWDVCEYCLNKSDSN